VGPDISPLPTTVHLEGGQGFFTEFNRMALGLDSESRAELIEVCSKCAGKVGNPTLVAYFQGLNKTAKK
jgi:hypothetical protein